jgi:hypothetical protein
MGLLPVRDAPSWMTSMSTWRVPPLAVGKVLYSSRREWVSDAWTRRLKAWRKKWNTIHDSIEKYRWMGRRESEQAFYRSLPKSRFSLRARSSKGRKGRARVPLGSNRVEQWLVEGRVKVVVRAGDTGDVHRILEPSKPSNASSASNFKSNR